MYKESFSVPRTAADIELFIEEKTAESRYLDFKSGRLINEKKYGELAGAISKQISGFANGGGGVVVIGVAEKGDSSHASCADNLELISEEGRNAEWLDQKLSGFVIPPVDGSTMFDIQFDGGHAIVIHIPMSSQAHQASDLKYYARRNFRTEPMAHYEIEDVRSRSERKKFVYQPLIIPSGTRTLEIVSENKNSTPIYDVEFFFPDDVSIVSSIKNMNAKIFGDFEGVISVLNPGTKYRHLLGFNVNTFSLPALNQVIQIGIKFKDQSGVQYFSEQPFSIKEFNWSTDIGSGERSLKEVSANTKNIATALKSIAGRLRGPDS